MGQMPGHAYRSCLISVIALSKPGGEWPFLIGYNLDMSYRAALVLGCIWTSALTGPASAHRPYFTKVEKIRLPNGEMGEARLLNGDGIIVPDPVRVIILDAAGHLLARSDKSLSIVLTCRGEGLCLIFDFSEGQVLDLVPSGFRQGPLVPGLGDHERNGLWGLEDGSESWGLKYRDPSFGEMVLGYGALLASGFPAVIFNMMIGAVCAFLAEIVTEIVRQTRTRYSETFMAALVTMIIMGLGLFALLVSLIASVFGRLTLGLWFFSLCLGGGLLFVRGRIQKRSQAQAASE